MSNTVTDAELRTASHVCYLCRTIFSSSKDVFAHECTKPSLPDPVNHPSHYTSHPSGVECITITEHMGFNVGNAVKYLWRADLKDNSLEDLEKAEFYIKREIAKRKKESEL